MKAATAILILALGAASPLAAADLVEPWARGLSNFELALATSSGGSHRASTVIGGGLTDRVSIGLTAGAEEREDTQVGVLLLYSQPLGPAGEVDVWCETSLDSPLDRTGCGLEWSRARPAYIPYARLTFGWDGPSESLASLAGVMVPVTEAVGVHFEIAMEPDEPAGRPLRFAVGPNWQVSPRVELIPELAWRRDHDEEDSIQLAIGLAMDISRE